GVAETRAVVDVVRAETGAHELLEEIRLLVRALGRSESRERALAVRVPDLAKTLRGDLERFFPRRFAEDVAPVLRIDREVLVLRHARLPDERLREPMPMLHVVEAVAAFHTEPARICRTVAALDVENRVALDVVRELAADAAVRAHGVDLLVDFDCANRARGHERAGRARLHALAAGDARRVAHRIVEVEHD